VRLIATLAHLPGAEELAALPPEVDWLEVRADLFGSPAADDLAPLAAHARSAGGGLLFTFRSQAEGGQGSDDPARRAERFEEAAAVEVNGEPAYALVDLEHERDLHPEVLEAVPAERRVLSWHGPAGTVAEIEDRIGEMTATPAVLYKVITHAKQPGEELPGLLALAAAGRPDVVQFSTGEGAAWTRLVAPRLGAPVVYGAFSEGEPGAPGQLSVARLVSDFCLPELRPVTALYGIAGNPISHSLSPRLHNRAYRALGLPALYVPFHVEHFGDFWLEVVEGLRLDDLGLPLKGLSVTAPHKEIAQAVAGASSPRTHAVGAANTLVENDGVWEAESTDPEGVTMPLRHLGVELRGAPMAVLGAGGAGRSAAVGLRDAGAEVTLLNRSEERGRQAAKDLGVPYRPLSDFDPGRYRVVVQATSLGRHPDDPLPFDPRALAPDAVVVDLVYTDGATPLLAAVEAAGRRAVDGREVLLYQAVEQFHLMTGRELPIPLAREALGLPPEPPRAE
jgi:3-dehydroquinate dehydratase / shikimate dehydrogenase